MYNQTYSVCQNYSYFSFKIDLYTDVTFHSLPLYFISHFDIIIDNCENCRVDKQSDNILQFFPELLRTCDKDLTKLRLNYISYHQPEQPIKLVALMH